MFLMFLMNYYFFCFVWSDSQNDNQISEQIWPSGADTCLSTNSLYLWYKASANQCDQAIKFCFMIFFPTWQ